MEGGDRDDDEGRDPNPESVTEVFQMAVLNLRKKYTDLRFSAPSQGEDEMVLEDKTGPMGEDVVCVMIHGDQRSRLLLAKMEVDVLANGLGGKEITMENRKGDGILDNGQFVDTMRRQIPVISARIEDTPRFTGTWFYGFNRTPLNGLKGDDFGKN